MICARIVRSACISPVTTKQAATAAAAAAAAATALGDSRQPQAIGVRSVGVLRRVVFAAIASGGPKRCLTSSAAAAASSVKIYTRTGDKGTSSLYTGERRPKDDITFDALGTTDELNAHIGLSREHSVLSGNAELLIISQYLEQIQSTLMEVGAHLATPRKSATPARLERTDFEESHTVSLEQTIDLLDAQLPPLRHFILPSGGLASAHLHVARSVCRRLERVVMPLLENGDVDPSLGRYVNRLSDFLFVAARYCSHKEGKPETIWRHTKKESPADSLDVASSSPPTSS